MDNNQNWTGSPFNPRPGVQNAPWGRPAQPGVQMPPRQMTMQNPGTPAGWPKIVSRTEKLEAMRAEMEERLNKYGLAGFQVVRREFMSHSFDPAMTVRENSVTFNNACISRLEAATYIQFLINPEEQKLIIRPCGEGDRDAVRWCVTKADKRKSRQITCRDFTERLYELMGWETVYRYRLQGIGIDYLGEKMYLFDLQSKEAFAPSVKDPDTGKVTRPKAIFPEEWTGSFGMAVEEHDLSTKVDLTAGYISAGTEGNESGKAEAGTKGDESGKSEADTEKTVREVNVNE